jgi:hypothetical protein
VPQKRSSENSVLGGSRVETVQLSGLERTRRGKHFDLMQQVLKGLADLASESALKIPLGGKSAKDLRSAVIRAAAKQHMEIASSSDDKNLYVWKKPY